MSLCTLQLASTSALALLASSADPSAARPIVLGSTDLRPEIFTDDLEPRRFVLNVRWRTKRTATDVLTELVDIDGIRVVADRRLWNRPDTLALRHDFPFGEPFQLYVAAGINRAVYLDSRALNPTTALEARRHRSVGMMTEAGASWRLTEQLRIETDIRWMDLSRNAQLMRTEAGWSSGDPLALTLSLVWHGK